MKNSLSLFDNKNLFITLTYRCNAFCKKCMTRYHKNCDMEMQLDLLEKIIDKLKLQQYNGLISVGSGEPLLYPHFSYFLTSILSVNDHISLRVLSNGMQFNSNLPADYFGSRCKWGITLDSFFQDTLSEFQYGIQIEQVKTNIKQVVKTCDSDCLYLNYTLHNRNYSELVDFCKFAVELGIKEVYATELKIYEGYEDRLSSYRLNYTPDVCQTLERASEILETNGISSAGIQIENYSFKPNCFLKKAASPIIDVNGDVTFCAGREDIIIGNILDSDIEEKWENIFERLAQSSESWCKFCHGKPLDTGYYTLPAIIDRQKLARQIELEKKRKL